MKILNIIQRYPPAVGGSETWCQEVCRHLAEKGHQVIVLTFDVNEEEQYYRPPIDTERTVALGKIALDKNVFVRRFARSLPIHTFHHLIYGALFDRILKIYFYGPHSGEMYGKMWREIRDADLIFLHTMPYPHNILAFLLAKLFKKKIVIVPHFHTSHPHYDRPFNYWLLKHCDAVITVSHYEKKYLKIKGIPEERLFVTGNAIHPKEFQPLDFKSFRRRFECEFGPKSENRVIVFIGRKTPEKGVNHLINAVKYLLPKIPVKLFLIGPSSKWYREFYTNLSKEEKKRIIDVGVVSHADKVNFLHIANLLVLPSKYEAFGIVFLEAWICGVPVMGTTEGAMPSVIGSEGLLCKFGNEEDMAIKMHSALKYPEELSKMGTMGKTKVLNHYTWDAIGEKVEKTVKKAYGKRKVIICTNAYPPEFVGGAELIAHNQAKVLSEKGYEVLVFAGMPNDKKRRYSIKKGVYEGIQVQRVCLDSRDYSTENVNFYHKEIDDIFVRLLDNFSPDLVHFHNITGLSVRMPEIARHRKIRTILTLHDYWAICHRNTLIRKNGTRCISFSACKECRPFLSDERWANLPVRLRMDYISMQLGIIDEVISPSVYLAETYEEAGLFRKKIKVIPNGIDIERFQMVVRKKNNKVMTFSFIGHLGKHKGVETIINALAHIKDQCHFKLNIIGDGELRAELEEIVRNTDLEKIVKFWGKVDNTQVEKVYAKTDVLILPSIWPENQPVVITEAMACSLPVIAARIGGIPELVEDGETGYLFEPGNHKDLADKMLQFILDPTTCLNFGKNGFKKIAEYTFENQVEKIINIYYPPQKIEHKNTDNGNLIICLGNDFNPVCAAALNSFLSDTQQTFSIVMCDWISENDIQNAMLLWVIDKSIDLNGVTVGLRNKIPLLVPESNEELKQLCISSNCGLYYSDDPAENKACLQYLANDESIRAAMGKNGFREYYANAPRYYDASCESNSNLNTVNDDWSPLCHNRNLC